jgi:hypothetical protein
VNLLVPIVTVPVREVVPVFAATLNVAVPDPFPVEPVVIHVALLTAVHAHPAAALTVAVTVAPVAASDWLVGEIVGEHGKLNEKVFERALRAAPPGPTALTTAS